ncbi:MAG: hypothetical protein K5707_04225 [Clostridia bacterium]|nr:hypothetical protein [Clostridia bacterium]
MLNRKGILEKVRFLLSAAKSGECGIDEFKDIVAMTREHTDNQIIGRVFGYSISDYALATLSWLGTEESIKAFRRGFNELSNIRKEEVRRLIDSKMYLEI